MARRKKGGGGDEGGSWMDTYGDLVTLLLTFFVLLYSMSSLDQSKWDLFVKSIYPGLVDDKGSSGSVNINGKVSTDGKEAKGGGNKASAEDVQATTDNMDKLYLMIAQKMDQQGVSGVSATRGKNYTFVEFKDKAFFNGDSSELTDQGKSALSVFCNIIAPEKDKISQVNIMGHTAQANPNGNNVRTDRMLAAMRAAEVCIYIQEQNVIEPNKIVSMEYGQFRPVESNDTKEGRAANRRVEILLIDKGADENDVDKIREEVNSGKDNGKTATTDGDPNTSVGEDATSTTVNSTTQ
ncbi:MAG: flagellar motor protein MotB [Lachnospiraceae bacterium]|nr:flagellar motor protein MotB [Lachnospiraceae bacterium]